MIINIPNSNLELRSKIDSDYKNYVEHVIEADELYLQYTYWAGFDGADLTDADTTEFKLYEEKDGGQ